MDWPTVTLILGGIAIVGVLIVGGTVRVKGIRVDSAGFLYWLREANEEKGAASQTASIAAQDINLRALRAGGKLPVATIAWVDDNPLNNVYERLAFASAGIFCDSYTRNDEALTALSCAEYDLVISDIGRDDQSETGWELLAQIVQRRLDVPFLFYTMGVTDDLRSQAKAEGAAGISEWPDELARLVFDILGRRA